MSTLKIILYCLFWLLVYFSIIATGRLFLELLKADNHKLHLTFNLFIGPLMGASGVWIGELISGYLVKQAKRFFLDKPIPTRN